MSLVFKRQLIHTFLKYYNFFIIETRERIQRFNNRLSLYVYNESDTKHHRPHAHVVINNIKRGVIFLDTFEVENLDNKKDVKEINEWLKNNKNTLIEAWKRNNNRIDIDF